MKEVEIKHAMIQPNQDIVDILSLIEVEMAIGRLRNGKAPEEEDTAVELIKNGGETTLKRIQYIL